MVAVIALSYPPDSELYAAGLIWLASCRFTGMRATSTSRLFFISTIVTLYNQKAKFPCHFTVVFVFTAWPCQCLDLLFSPNMYHIITNNVLHSLTPCIECC